MHFLAAPPTVQSTCQSESFTAENVCFDKKYYYKYQYRNYQYQWSKYQYKYQYLACKYKYKYQYPKTVLKYRSSTSTSTKYNKTAGPKGHLSDRSLTPTLTLTVTGPNCYASAADSSNQ